MVYHSNRRIYLYIYHGQGQGSVRLKVRLKIKSWMEVNTAKIQPGHIHTYMHVWLHFSSRPKTDTPCSKAGFVY